MSTYLDFCRAAARAAHDRILAKLQPFQEEYDRSVKNGGVIDPTKQAEFERRVDEMAKDSCD